MSLGRRAWLASLALHAIALGAFVALMPASRGVVGVVPAIDTRTIDIGIVLLDDPPPRPLPPMLLPAVPAVPLPPVTPPPAEPVQRTTFAEPPPLPRATRPPDMPSAPNGPARPVSPPGPPPAAPSPPRQIAFCGVPASGSSVVYVVDRSASMGVDGRFDRARREVADSLRRLPAETRFQVIAYHRSATLLPGTSGLIAATPQAVDAACAHLDSLAAEGGNGHRPALALALSLRPDAVYYLTDDDELTADDVRAVTQLNRGKASIHALCLVAPTGTTPMRQLAAQNRGVFRAVSDPPRQ